LVDNQFLFLRFYADASKKVLEKGLNEYISGGSQKKEWGRKLAKKKL
jgi:hypothetical protein